MGDRYMYTILPSNLGQLSLATSSWIDKMSTAECWWPWPPLRKNGKLCITVSPVTGTIYWPHWLKVLAVNRAIRFTWAVS